VTNRRASELSLLCGSGILAGALGGMGFVITLFLFLVVYVS
jgi:hypothetical protein